MNKYKIYLQMVLAFAFLAFMAGFLIPWLISAKSTIAVILGVVLIVLTGLFLMGYPGYFLKQFAKDDSNEKN